MHDKQLHTTGQEIQTGMSIPSETVIRAPSQSAFRSRAERIEAGRLLRAELPRSAQASWKAPAHRRDAIEVLKDATMIVKRRRA